MIPNIHNKCNVDKFDVNITNVCNFNCSDCQTFSNFNFKGHQIWKDYKEIYRKWSDIVNPKKWAILGGEPLLNPTFSEWVIGLNELFPNVPCEIQTNGSLITEQRQDLYDLFLKIKSGIVINLQLHNISRREKTFQIIKNWLHEPITITRMDKIDPEIIKFLGIENNAKQELNSFEKLKKNWVDTYRKIKAESWPECQDPSDWHKLPQQIKDECINNFNLSNFDIMLDNQMGFLFTDVNNISVYINNADHFSISSLIPAADQTHFKLYDSDPLKAHNVCASKGCFTFYKGKGYKCHQVAHFSDFDEQFYIVLDNENDRQLLHSYQPATIDLTSKEFREFLEQSLSENPIAQCKFCPEHTEFVEISAQPKKISFQKRKK